MHLLKKILGLNKQEEITYCIGDLNFKGWNNELFRIQISDCQFIPFSFFYLFSCCFSSLSNLNSCQTAAYEALFNSIWYQEGGFKPE